MQNQHPILKELETLSSLPSPPQVAMRIIEVTRDEDSGVSDLADVLRSDAALAAKVLQVSNSTAYARSREVTTLSDAVNLLGLKSLSIISLGFSLKQSVPDFKVGNLTQDVLWQHTIGTAVVARCLSRYLGKTNDELAFMCGLLSRIGQLVLFTSMSDRYVPVVTNSEHLLPDAADEQAVLGISHHQVARLLLEKWHLPSAIIETVERWGDTDDDLEGAEDIQQLTRILRVADVARMLLFEEDKATSLQALHDAAEANCNLTPDEFDTIFVACQNELRDTLSVFIDQQTEEIDCEAILASARERILQVSVAMASDLSAMTDRCESLTESNSQLEVQSMTDALTGLSNRLALTRKLEDIEKSHESGRRRPYSVVMLDIDKFKSFNDTYGHDVGDQVLKTVGQALADSVRGTDFVARYGGEEFTVVLPNCDQEEALTVAERFRSAVGKYSIDCADEKLFVTSSAGVASSDCDGITGVDYQTLLKRADKALYEAKKSGRNQTVQYLPSQQSEDGSPRSLSTTTT